MERVYELADRVSRIATWVGGALLLLSAAIITADVVLRKIFNTSLGGSDELASYALAISTSWGLSFALMRRANIRIDALYSRLPQRLNAWLDLLALLLMGAFMALVAWFATRLWFGSLEMHATANTPLQTPLAMPQGLWIAGFALFLLVMLVLLVRVSMLLARGELDNVGKCAGIRSVEEEVRDELSDELLGELRDKASQHAA